MEDRRLHSITALAPLWGTGGPNPNEVIQGATGDCYFCAALSSVARKDPALIAQDIRETGTNTFEVQFQRNGQPVWEQVTVPNESVRPIFAGGAQSPSDGDLWFPVMEKAFTEFRNPSNQTYASITGGLPNEVYSDLGCSNESSFSTSSAPQLDAKISSWLAQGRAVALNTAEGNSSPVPGTLNSVYLVPDHSYEIYSINADGSINLRNPWGKDPTASGPYLSDGTYVGPTTADLKGYIQPLGGYFAISAQQAAASMTDIESAALPVTANVNGELFVTGTAANNTISLYSRPSGYFDVVLNGVDQIISPANVYGIEIDTGTGHDVVNIDGYNLWEHVAGVTSFCNIICGGGNDLVSIAPDAQNLADVSAGQITVIGSGVTVLDVNNSLGNNGDRYTLSDASNNAGPYGILVGTRPGDTSPFGIRFQDVTEMNFVASPTDSFHNGDLAATNVFAIAGGVQYIDADNANRTIDLSTDAAGYNLVSIDGYITDTISPTTIDGIQIDTGTGHDVVNINGFTLWKAAPDHFLNIVCGGGNDLVSIAPGTQNLADVSAGHITVIGSGVTVLDVNDSLGNNGDTYTLSNATNNAGPYGILVGTRPGDTSPFGIRFQDVTEMSFVASPTDSFNNADLVATNVFAIAGGVQYIDADNANRTIDLSTDGAGYNLVSIDGYITDTISPMTIDGIQIDTGSGKDIINVNGFNLDKVAPDHFLNIVTGAGADTVNLSEAAETLSNLTSGDSHTTIVGGGDTTVNVFDTDDTASVGYSLSNVEISQSLQWALFTQLRDDGQWAFNMRMFYVNRFNIYEGPNAGFLPTTGSTPGLTSRAFVAP